MLAINEFWQFNDYLKTGYQNKKEAETILNDIFKLGEWRAEWLDAYFEGEKEQMFIYTQNKSKKEKLDKCIQEDCYVNLKFNKQGLPTEKSKSQNYEQGKNIHYWSPVSGGVARFSSDVAVLYWDSGNPNGSDASLGVRACAEGAGLKKI